MGSLSDLVGFGRLSGIGVTGAGGPIVAIVAGCDAVVAGKGDRCERLKDITRIVAPTMGRAVFFIMFHQYDYLQKPPHFGPWLAFLFTTAFVDVPQKSEILSAP